MFRETEDTLSRDALYGVMFKTSFARLFHLGRGIIDKQALTREVNQASTKLTSGLDLDKEWKDYDRHVVKQVKRSQYTLEEAKKYQDVTLIFNGSHRIELLSDAENAVNFNIQDDADRSRAAAVLADDLTEGMNDELETAVLKLTTTELGCEVGNNRNQQLCNVMGAYKGVTLRRNDTSGRYEALYVFTIADEVTRSADMAFVFPEAIKSVVTMADQPIDPPRG